MMVSSSGWLHEASYPSPDALLLFSLEYAGRVSRLRDGAASTKQVSISIHLDAKDSIARWPWKRQLYPWTWLPGFAIG
jgi:hypothetical protein